MDVVPNREKEWCWQELKKNFTVPAESEEICKRWTLSKMAEQLQSFKQTLTKKYIKTGTTPVFSGELEKQKDETKRHIVLSGKRNIVGVEDKTDLSEEYNNFVAIPPFEVMLIYASC